MDAREILKIDADEEVAECDGGGGALGHPLIYLSFDGKTRVDCYYCGQRYAKPAYFSDTQQAPV